MAKKAIVSVGNSEPILYPVNLTESHFNSIIFDKGYTCFIETAMLCPCTYNITGGSQSNCKNCGSTGYYWINKKETRLFITNLNNTTSTEKWTDTNVGIANISARMEDKMGLLDKVTICEQISTYIQKTVISIENGVKFALVDFQPIEIEELFLFINSDESLLHIPKEDYEIVNSGITISNKYATNSTLSIKYKYHPVYHIIEILRENVANYIGDTKQNLPLKYRAKRASVVFDADNMFDTRLLDNTNVSEIKGEC